MAFEAMGGFKRISAQEALRRLFANIYFIIEGKEENESERFDEESNNEDFDLVEGHGDERVDDIESDIDFYEEASDDDSDDESKDNDYCVATNRIEYSDEPFPVRICDRNIISRWDGTNFY